MVLVKHNSRVPRTPLGVFPKYKSLKARKFLTGPFSDKAQTTALSFFVPIDASWRAVITKYILADFKTNRSNNIDRVERWRGVLLRGNSYAIERQQPLTLSNVTLT